jgi:hypothetical protein
MEEEFTLKWQEERQTNQEEHRAVPSRRGVTPRPVAECESTSDSPDYGAADIFVIGRRHRADAAIAVRFKSLSFMDEQTRR